MEEIREQPMEEQTNALNKAEEESVASDIGSQNNDSASEYGKFKSREALLDAYNNLEKEFTRKCQRLSELEKDKTEENEGVSFEDKFSQFLSENADATGYSEEIKKIAQSDEKIKSLQDPFMAAWCKVLCEDVLHKASAGDYCLNKYVLSSQEIQNKIVEDYLGRLREQKNPVVMSSSSGERVSSAEVEHPSTLEEAKQLVDKMFR